MIFVYGLAGMRDFKGHLSFQPKLPNALVRLRFPLTIRGQVLEVDIQKQTVTYLLREGSELVISHQDQEVRLTVGEPVEMKS